ncbi:MAG: hypothetical protein DCF12_18880 [Snowella sp.]|nr:MAG: hypothetical protein DCF12_18880 [Snowella sp.]
MTMNALTVNLKSLIEMTDEQFFQLCQNNRELRFERNILYQLVSIILVLILLYIKTVFLLASHKK